VPGSAPRNVTVIVLSPNNITVNWNEVDLIDQNGLITLYEVEYIAMDNFEDPIVAVRVNVTAPNQVFEIFGLEAYVNYSIAVRAFTSQGGGEFSDQVIVLTDEDSESIFKDMVLMLIKGTLCYSCAVVVAIHVWL